MNRASFIGGEGFWRFSLALYARPGVADALIALQDRAGADVNLVLYGLWLGVCRGRRLNTADVASAANAIAPLADIVLPLRGLRRRLKSAADPDLQALRRQIAALELAAERRAEYRLAARLPNGPAAQDGLAAATHNLAVIFGGEAKSDKAGVLLRALAALTRSGDGGKVAASR